MRGIVSLAAALALPVELADGTPFPYRDLIIFFTFVDHRRDAGAAGPDAAGR